MISNNFLEIIWDLGYWKLSPTSVIQLAKQGTMLSCTQNPTYQEQIVHIEVVLKQSSGALSLPVQHTVQVLAVVDMETNHREIVQHRNVSSKLHVVCICEHRHNLKTGSLAQRKAFYGKKNQLRLRFKWTAGNTVNFYSNILWPHLTVVGVTGLTGHMGGAVSNYVQ